MAGSGVQGPQFEPLLCTDQNDDYPQTFNPFAHDIIVLNGLGRPEIAKDASVEEMIKVLGRSNYACRESGDSNVPPLILM